MGIFSIFKFINPLKIIDVILDRFMPSKNLVESEKTKRAQTGAEIAMSRIKSKSWLDKWVAVLGYILGLLIIIENVVFKLINAFFGLHIPTDGEAIGLIAGVITLTYGVGQYQLRKHLS